MDPSEKSKLVLDVCLAEYSTLTARCTSYMAASFAPLPLLVAYIALISIEEQGGIAFKYWWILLGIVIAVDLFQFCNYEQCSCVWYMESVLKPRIVRLVGDEHVLEYEQWLLRDRKAEKIAGDFLIPILGLLILAAGILPPLHPHDLPTYAALLLCVLFVAMGVWLTRRVSTVHRSWMRSRVKKSS